MRKIIPFLLFIFLFSALLLSQERSFKVVAKTGDGKILKLYKGCYALVIGVSDYLSGWPDLPNAARDADDVGDLLSKLDFKVTRVINPTSSQLKQALDTFVFSHGQKEGNCLVIFFAGHGHTEKLAYGDDMGYIVPIDAPSPEWDNAGFKQKAIDMQAIEAYARRIEAKHALFLFDSCFSGAIFNMGRAIPPAYISSKTEKQVRQFITAGGADEVVPDKSIFKGQLIEGLGGEADRNKDGYVTGTELGEFLQEKVVNYSRRSQHPQYGKIRDPNLDKGDFVFVLEKPDISEEEEIQLPPKPLESERVDLASIKKAKEEREKIKSEWESRLADMISDFNEVEKIDKSPEYNIKEKKTTWQKFINSYKEDNPLSSKDDNLRQRARQRLSYWLSEIDFAKGAARAPGDIMPPKLIKEVEPIYPEEARKERVEGVVIIEVRTDEYGNVEACKVLRSIPLLDEEAIRAVKQWKYEPMIFKGKPTPVVFVISVPFFLNKKHILLPE